MVRGKAKERWERRRSAKSGVAGIATNASVVGWTGPAGEPPSGGGASVATESPRDAGAVVWGTVGVMGSLVTGGTVMCLLDNGTEGATKRFTASFAFSEVSRCVRLPGSLPSTFSRTGHSSNSLARKR